MHSALKVKLLLVTVSYVLFRFTVVRAKPPNNPPTVLAPLAPEKKPTLPKQDTISREHPASAVPQENNAKAAEQPLPLVKPARSNVMDLLHLFFIAKPTHFTPTYSPILHHIGLRINWLEWLQNLWQSDQNSYGGGVDFDLLGSIQLSFDVGYGAHQPRDIAYGNTSKHALKGVYGLGNVLYLMHPNRLTNACIGIGYGQSRFNLTILNGQHETSTTQTLGTGWIKLVGGSEVSLISQLYGGLQFSVAYLVHNKKNPNRQVSNYFVPGYGRIVNTIVPDITCYLKWGISFLEKKIII